MTIKEYRFLTKTMGEISRRSTFLTKRKKELYNIKLEVSNQKKADTKREIRSLEGEIKSLLSQIEDKELTASALNREIKAMDVEVKGIRKRGKRSTMAPFMKRLSPARGDDMGSLFVLCVAVATLVVFALMNLMKADIEGKGLLTFLQAAMAIMLFGCVYPFIALVVDVWKKKRMDRAILLINKEKAVLSKQIKDKRRVEILSVTVKKHRQFVKKNQEWLRTAEQEVLDSTKEIIRLEGDLEALWSSIAYLIPYSSAL